MMGQVSRTLFQEWGVGEVYSLVSFGTVERGNGCQGFWWDVQEWDKIGLARNQLMRG